MNSRARTATTAVIETVKSYGTDTYGVLYIYDTLCQYVPDENTNNDMVAQAALDPTIVAPLMEGKKINAIKEARRRFQIGLKEAKDLVEDPRLAHLYNVSGFVNPNMRAAAVKAYRDAQDRYCCEDCDGSGPTPAEFGLSWSDV
jgi:ribosomal protein L7/L12